MSAPPPPNAPNGQPGQAAKRPYRRPRAVNPLVARGRNDPSKQMNRPASTVKPSATVIAKAGPSKDPVEALREQDYQKLKDFESRRKLNGGWTDPAPPNVVEYPLMVSKRALMEARFHVMRLSRAKAVQGDPINGIDPTDPEQFSRPVTLHRRDPRQPAAARVVPEEEEVKETPPPPEPTTDDKEAERLAQIKADKEAQRAADLAQIAPIIKPNEPPAQKKPQPQKKEKAFTSHRQTKKDYDPKTSELRYEEALPWHLEDADGKNVWVGQYVAALSQANVGLVISGEGFKMVPLEKYYKFTSKPHFKAFSIEQAESIMKQNVAIGPHKMTEEKKEQMKLEQEIAATRDFLRGGRATKVKKESNTYRSAPRSEKLDQDDIDMSGDEFQDDDENHTFEKERDEETKEAKERQRRNHLGANLFGDANEKQVEKEEAEEELMEQLRKEEGKRVRKALARREKHLMYQSDSDDKDNPYDSSSSSESEPDEEKEAKEKEAKEKEAKEKEAKEAKEKEKLAVGASAKGSGTSPGKNKQGKSLKRPGSPNLSESSENEASRKKAKKLATGSVQPSRSGTPVPGQRAKGPGGATSDGEATGGEMSDGGIKKNRLKLGATGSSSRGTPVGSRAGSPIPGSGSKPGSPIKADSPKPGVVTPDEIVAALAANPQGIAIGDLLKRYFSDRVGTGENQIHRKEFISLVVRHSQLDKVDKLLRMKPTK
ncbi:hypothetical protein PspLS_05079 [Pyricularia sp. CBS 133598]|nr:hypothetical protein PspLS_05079 [Pyricularia sp. CBS 133598]